MGGEEHTLYNKCQKQLLESYQKDLAPSQKLQVVNLSPWNNGQRSYKECKGGLIRETYAFVTFSLTNSEISQELSHRVQAIKLIKSWHTQKKWIFEQAKD